MSAVLHVVNIPTGQGKTEAILRSATPDVLVAVPTHKLADEVEARYHGLRGRATVRRYVGLLHPRADGSYHCIQPQVVRAAIGDGYPARGEVCSSCPVLETCIPYRGDEDHGEGTPDLHLTTHAAVIARELPAGAKRAMTLLFDELPPLYWWAQHGRTTVEAMASWPLLEPERRSALRTLLGHPPGRVAPVDVSRWPQKWSMGVDRDRPPNPAPLLAGLGRGDVWVGRRFFYVLSRLGDVLDRSAAAFDATAGDLQPLLRAVLPGHRLVDGGAATSADQVRWVPCSTFNGRLRAWMRAALKGGNPDLDRVGTARALLKVDDVLALREPPRRTLLVVAHKDVADHIRSWPDDHPTRRRWRAAGVEQLTVMHYHGLRGLDTANGVDVGIFLGAPFPRVGQVRREADALGLDPTVLQRALLDAEWTQALGRLRLNRNPHSRAYLVCAERALPSYFSVAPGDLACDARNGGTR